MTTEGVHPPGGEIRQFVEPDALQWRGIQARIGDRFGSRDVEVLRVQSGTGSYFIFDEDMLLIDPKQMHDPEDAARGEERCLFEAINDGAHAMIGRGPKELGLRESIVENRYDRIGYALTQAVIEDSAMNRWAAKKLPEAEDIVSGAYSGKFSRRELDVLKKYGITKTAQMPLFMQFSFELLRKNHEGWYTRDDSLSFDAQTAAGNVAQDAHAAADMTPKFIIEYFTKRNARKRFNKVDDDIWPEAERLVEQDIRTIMANLVRTRAQYSEQPEPHGDITPTIPPSWAPRPSDIIPPKHPLDLLEDPKLVTGQEITWNLWERPTHFDGLDIREIYNEPVFDDLYPDPLIGLEEEQLLALRAEAEQILKNLEDKVVMAMRAQHEEDDVAPTHQEIDRPKYEEAVRRGNWYGNVPFAQGQVPEVDHGPAAAAALSDEVRTEFIGALDAWSRTRMEVAATRAALSARLTSILFEAVNPAYRATSSGIGKVIVDKAIALELGVSSDLEIFEGLDPPEPQFHRFIFLFDRSGSMSGRKEQESFKAAVTAVDTLDELDVDVAVGVFANQTEIIKGFHDDLEEHREDLSSAMMSNGGGTATNKAAATAVEMLQGFADARYRNYVVFVTDGHPNADAIDSLIENIQTLHDMGVPTIGVCIGEESEEIRKYCAFSISLPSFDDDPDDTTDFAAEMSDVIEVAVRLKLPLKIEAERID